MADIHDQHKRDRDGFVKNDANRESFFELHQGQKDAFDTEADRLDNFESRPGIQLDSMSRLRCYVTLTDANLGVFINNAQSKAKLAYLTGTRNWHHHYTIDVADVDIRLRGRAVHIRIMPADRFFFEFASSCTPVQAMFDGSSGFNTYRFAICGVDVRIDKGALITRPTILKQKRDTLGQNLSTIKRATQVQLQSEPVMYPRSEFKFGRIRTINTLFQCYDPIYAWSGVTLRGTDMPFATFGQSTICGPGTQFTSRDIFFDVPYGDNSKLKPVRYAYVQGAADWPRANGNQLVKSVKYGEREFAIYVDDFGQFMVFPVAAIEPVGGTPPTGDPLAQNVDEVYIRRIVPTLPGWGWLPTAKAKDYWAGNPDVKEWSTDQPQFCWKFNHLGTKCATLLMERIEYVFDATFWSTDATPGCPMDFAKFELWKQWGNSDTNYVEGFAPTSYNNHRYFIAPGIIELDINIEITGGNLEDFDVTIKVNELLRPSTDTNNYPWTMAVDYVWHDIPKRTNTSAVVKAGTLVVLDIELWLHPAGTLGEDTDRQVLWSVRDFKTNVEVFSAVGAPLLALDLRTLSMVLRLDAYSTVAKSGGDGTPLNFPIHHFGAWIIHSGVGKEVLFPENTPEDMKLVLNSYASLTGRDYFAAKIAATGGAPWQFLTLSTAYDGWTNASLNGLRDWWANQDWYWYDQWYALVDPDLGHFGDHVRYKSASPPPAYPSDGDATQKALNAIGGNWRNLMFCDYPLWAWTAYIELVPAYMNLCTDTTFFAHPNGTYAYWDNGWIYDRNGLPGDYVIAQGAGGQSGIGQGSGADYTHNTLAVYDASLIEHVIFDRVHFEIRATNQPAKTHNTTFLALFNKAVDIGQKAKTLADDIIPMQTNDFRGVFAKEIGNDTNNEYEFLDLKMTWDGKDWWYRESAYSHGYATSGQLPPMVGTAANFNNLNVYCFWRTTNYVGGGIAFPAGAQDSNDPTHWHRRFADPIVITEK